MGKWGPVAGIALILVVGCGSPGETASVPSTAQSPSVASESSPSMSTSATEDSGQSETSTPTADGPPIIEPSAGVPQKLVLSDAFKAEAWDEGSYKPAGESADVNGFVNAVQCYSNEGDGLEFRLGAQPGTLKFTAAQELRSDSPANTLEVAVEADGRVVETKNIAFKESAKFAVDVSGVASLRILVSRVNDREECRGPSTALIYGMELVG